MTFARDNGPADSAALAEFEKRLGGLPHDYRNFIALHNGVDLSGTASLRGSDRWAVESIEGIQDTEFWSEDYPPDCMPIATDGTGNIYLMALAAETRGQIYFLDHELSSEAEKPVTELPRIAISFADFLARIQDFDPEDPEDEQLFHELAQRRLRTEQQRQAILNPKNPWWKVW